MPIYRDNESEVYRDLRYAIIRNTLEFDRDERIILDKVKECICRKNNGKSCIRTYMIIYIYMQIGYTDGETAANLLGEYINNVCPERHDMLIDIFNECYDFMYDNTDRSKIMDGLFKVESILTRIIEDESSKTNESEEK